MQTGGRTPTPESIIVAALLEEEREQGGSSTEHRTVPLFPNVPAAKEDESGGGVTGDGSWGREQVQLRDVSLIKYRDTNGGPEGGDNGAVEEHGACRLERSSA
jgi:hypothetical protein